MDPASEGRGIARPLLAAACDHLARAGHAKAWLTTGTGTRAERFYRHQGWRQTGRTDDGQIISREGAPLSRPPHWPARRRRR
jgi:GNAT superfamily N-acetyltransferase